MIYTLTLNPALDYIMRVENIQTSDINRSVFEELHYGGKGINVSVVLTRLGIKNKALGFTAGFTGEYLEKLLCDEGVDCAFLRIPCGNTRINVKIEADNGIDINARGPEIPAEYTEKLIGFTDEIKDGDCLVLAGSVPENMPGDIYETVLSRLENKKVNVVADATGDLLLSVLKYKPFLIKPNHLELGDLFGVSAESDGDIVFYGKKLISMGAQNVLVSRGEKGAIFICGDGRVMSVGAVSGEPVNTVGCGDSMVAGFLAGYIEKGDYEYALRMGAAAGSATAFCRALASEKDIKNIFNTLKTN